jgi:hypothetical protein
MQPSHKNTTLSISDFIASITNLTSHQIYQLTGTSNQQVNYAHQQHELARCLRNLLVYRESLAPTVPISPASHEARLLVDAASHQLPPCMHGQQCVGMTYRSVWATSSMFPGVVWAQYLTPQEWQEWKAGDQHRDLPTQWPQWPPRPCILCYRHACTQWWAITSMIPTMIVPRRQTSDTKHQVGTACFQLYHNTAQHYTASFFLPSHIIPCLSQPVVRFNAKLLDIVPDRDGWRCDQWRLVASDDTQNPDYGESRQQQGTLQRS